MFILLYSSNKHIFKVIFIYLENYKSNKIKYYEYNIQSLSMDKKKIIGIVVGSITFILVYVSIQQMVFKSPSFDKQMMQTASELNKSCPIMVDSETRLDNAIALPENTFQYNYTLVNMTKEDMNVSEAENFLQPNILNSIKTNPDLKVFRDNNVIMVYNYKDNNGNHLFKLIFEPSQYK